MAYGCLEETSFLAFKTHITIRNIVLEKFTIAENYILNNELRNCRVGDLHRGSIG